MKNHIQPQVFAEKPYYELTCELLDCVRDHNYTRLSHICDDDYGIIDINPTGWSEIIRDRKGWEDWFTGLFSKLKTMNAETWSEITSYEAIAGADMGYSVVEFDQMFIAGGQTLKFAVTATIIWKLRDGVWQESRYHSSLISMGPV